MSYPFTGHREPPQVPCVGGMVPQPRPSLASGFSPCLEGMASTRDLPHQIFVPDMTLEPPCSTSCHGCGCLPDTTGHVTTWPGPGSQALSLLVWSWLFWMWSQMCRYLYSHPWGALELWPPLSFYPNATHRPYRELPPAWWSSLPTRIKSGHCGVCSRWLASWAF